MYFAIMHWIIGIILSIVSFKLILILINIFRESICCYVSPFTICHLPISIDSLCTRKLMSLAATIILLNYMIGVYTYFIFIGHPVVAVTLFCLVHSII